MDLSAIDARVLVSFLADGPADAVLDLTHGLFVELWAEEDLICTEALVLVDFPRRVSIDLDDREQGLDIFALFDLRCDLCAELGLDLFDVRIGRGWDDTKLGELDDRFCCRESGVGLLGALPGYQILADFSNLIEAFAPALLDLLG